MVQLEVDVDYGSRSEGLEVRRSGGEGVQTFRPSDFLAFRCSSFHVRNIGTDYS